MQRNRIAVIGAGIAGVVTAVYLQRDEHAVTLLNPNPSGTGTTSGNEGSLAPGSIVPPAARCIEVYVDL